MEDERREITEDMSCEAPVEPTPELEDLKRKVLKLRKSKKVKRIGGLVVAAVLVLVAALSVISYSSPKAVAKRYLDAYVYRDYVTMNKLMAYDVYAYELYWCDGDEEKFFEEVSDEFDEDIYSWKELSKYMREYVDEELCDEYGDYSISYEVTREKDISIRKLEEEEEYLIERLEKRANFDIDNVTKAKVITIKVKIKGEDETERETIEVYMVKIGGRWKVLSA